MKLDNVKVGDKVQFVYTGGSHPNSIRTVIVSEVNSITINGFDEYVNEYRSFLKDKIKFLQFIKPKEKLSVSIEKYGIFSFKIIGIFVFLLVPGKGLEPPRFLNART